MALLPRVLRSPNRLTRFLRRVALGKDREAMIARWQAQAEAGAALQRLTDSPDWSAVLAIVERLKHTSDEYLRSLTISAEHRMIAAVEWRSFQAVIREIHEDIRKGQQAQEALEKVMAQSKT